MEGYANDRNRTEREDFDNKLASVKISTEEALVSSETSVDREIPIEEIDKADKYYSDAEEIFKNPDIIMKRQELLEKLEQVEQKIQQTEGDPKLTEKYKQVSDKIRTKLLWEAPKYNITIEEITMKQKSNILENLQRLREWLRRRFPAIAALVAFTAGVFSIVFAVVKLTKGAAVARAKTTHSEEKLLEGYQPSFVL